MEYEAKCSRCGRSTINLLDYRCLCGSPLELHPPLRFKREQIRRRSQTMWRYRRFFPYVNEGDIISLGEGWTPLTRFSGGLYFKLDYLNPTGSFKDRGSTVMISAVRSLVKRAGGYVSEDSSGNAGASIAGYAARAGLKARIYVPEGVSGQKFNQILFYGAEVVRVPGERSRVTEEALKPERGKFYIGHVWHPIFRDGIRSLAYELAEQFGWRLPDRIYVPVSAGTLLLGLMDGLEHLSDSGLTSKLPTVVACQTEQVSPLYHRLKNLSYNPPERITSIADALISINPPLLGLMVRRMKEAEGDAELVSEEEVLEGFLELARVGLFVEPSSAVAYSAYKKQVKKGAVTKGDKVVVVLTGSGLKSKLEPLRQPTASHA